MQLGLSQCFQNLVLAVGVHAYKRYLLNASWRRTYACGIVGMQAFNLLYLLTIYFSPFKNGWWYVFTQVDAEFAYAFTFVIGIIIVPEITLPGYEGVIYGAITTYQNQAQNIANAINNLLLSSKFLWRQGYVRCPDACDADMEPKECVCSCPDAVLDGRSSHEVLNATGLLGLNPQWASYINRGKATWDDLFNALCHVGHAGEMFTSAAPYDPLFWSLHGTAERFLGYKRLAAERGQTQLRESWGYHHEGFLISDTHRVCDWTNATGLELPTCAPGVCPGHREDDVLPFEYVFGAGGQQYYSNAEFYAEISPSNDEMPYVYDKLQTWPGCEGGTMSFGSATAAR